jgi:hypothetical protein
MLTKDEKMVDLKMRLDSYQEEYCVLRENNDMSIAARAKARSLAMLCRALEKALESNLKTLGDL